ncbi:MAG: esterase-like activity of phytase family protein [Oceanicaulis sp.]
MRLSLVLAALAAIGAAACGPSTPETAAVTAQPVPLFPDDPGRVRLGALAYAGGVALSAEAEAFGGISAMEIDPETKRLLAVTDQGVFMTARITFEDGAPSGLSDIVFAPMLDPERRALEDRQADAEGLAPLGEGRYVVSFEREHRLAVYDLGPDWSAVQTAQPSTFPAPPGADRLRDNAGMEALAATGGALYAGIEDPIMDGTPHTIWRYDLENAAAPPRALSLAAAPGFGLTAMTTDGEGGLFLVERYWSREIGNRIRIGRLTAMDLAEAGPAPLQPEILAELGPDMTVDNFEAIALAEIDGEARLFILSDDNFNPDQRTLLLSFTLAGE